MLTEDTIRQALRDCYHPELPCNIVDLGLINTITITPDPEAPGANIPGVPSRHRVQITLTIPDDTSQSELTAQIQNRLAAFETISHTEVALVQDPPWSPNRISPEGRRRLSPNALQQPSPLIQIKLVVP